MSIFLISNLAGVRFFATSRLLLADPQTNNSERAEVNTFAQDSNNNLSSSDEGNITDSNSTKSSNGDERIDLAHSSPASLSNANLIEFTRQLEDIRRHPEEMGIEGNKESSFREFWFNRSNEMRAELESRRQQGLLSSPVPSEGSCVSCKEKNYVSPDNYYLEKKKIKRPLMLTMLEPVILLKIQVM